MSSDERLVGRAKRGDRHAFEAIYERYHQQLYRFCLAMVGNPQDAQDALQNTMVKVLRALPGEEREIQLKPWLYRIARNESVEALRKRRDNVELKPHQMVGGGVVEAAETRERLRILLGDLEQLPERQRAVLVMRELAGLEFDQIGAGFDTSAAVVRQTLYEARLSLRELEAGREMRCADVMTMLSDADGRVARRRDIRAHLRGCADCRAFRDEIKRRRHDLAAIAPLPPAAAVALLQGVLGKTAATGGALAGSGSLAGGAGVGAGKAVATSAVVKSAAAVAVAAVVGVSAVDRSGLVDLPLSDQDATGVTDGATKPVSPADTVDGASGASGARREIETASGRTANEQGVRAGHTEARRGAGATDATPDEDAGSPSKGLSRSQAGLNPPGGGHGRSASKRNGPPEGLPDAASHGQQTAAGNKPAHAATPTSKEPGSDRGSRPAAAETPPPPKAKAPATPASPPPAADPGPQTESGAASDNSDTVLPGPQR